MTKVLSYLFLAGLFYSLSASADPKCMTEEVPTPDSFFQATVDKTAGAVSIRLPSCTILSVGFLKYGSHTLAFQVSDGAQVGPLNHLTYLESSQDPRGTRLHGFFAVPDGVMLSGLLVRSSGAALLPTELFFVKFDNGGEVDKSVFRGRGSTHFSTNPAEGPYTFMPEFHVKATTLSGDQVDVGLYCAGGSQWCGGKWNDPKSMNITMGWRLPTLTGSSKPIQSKCQDISGVYTDSWDAHIVLQASGCQSLALNYDNTNSDVEAEFKFTETVLWSTTGQWINSRSGGWQQWYVENGKYRRLDFNDRFVAETATAELIKPKQDTAICNTFASGKDTYLVWRLPDHSCADMWFKKR